MTLPWEPIVVRYFVFLSPLPRARVLPASRYNIPCIRMRVSLVILELQESMSVAVSSR